MAQWEATLTTNSIQTYSDINDIKLDSPVSFPNYAMCLPRYSKMDGSYENAPDTVNGNVGYVSLAMSGADGTFTTKPTITVEFARKKTSGGVRLMFNTVSNDYCNSLHIEWYKEDASVGSADFAPDSADYTCYNKIGVFDKFIITFNTTNKPYRYLWVAIIDNFRLTKSSGLKIVYDDVAYMAKEHIDTITVTSGTAESYSDLDVLRDDTKKNYPDYAMSYPRYSKLDGGYVNAPDTINDLGFISANVSKEDKSFDVNPCLKFTFTETITSTGITLFQNSNSGDYCDCITITWYKDDAILSSKSFYPDSYVYFCENKVEYYNRVDVSMWRTSKPYRPAFLQGIDFGNSNFIISESDITKCTIYQEISPLSDELSINTANFTFRLPNGIHVIDFETRQKVYVYFDLAIVGIFYLKNGSQNSEMIYTMKCEDFVSILDGENHAGGIYTGSKASDVIADIFSGDDATVYVDDEIASKLIYGYLPYDTKRKNLSQVAFACGAVVDTSFDNRVFIYPYSVTGDPVTIGKGLQYSNTPKINVDTIVTGVNVTVHSYVANTEATTLYDEAVTGQITVVFDSPQHDLTITGGTIISSGVNYAVISGTGSTVTLTGKGYTHTEQIISKENSNVFRDKNIKNVTDATLVTKENGSDVLSRVYAYLSNSEHVSLTMLLNDFELGEYVLINTFAGDKTGVITSLSMTFSNDIKAVTKIKCLS